MMLQMDETTDWELEDDDDDYFSEVPEVVLTQDVKLCNGAILPKGIVGSRSYNKLDRTDLVSVLFKGGPDVFVNPINLIDASSLDFWLTG